MRSLLYSVTATDPLVFHFRAGVVASRDLARLLSTGAKGDESRSVSVVTV